MGKLLELLAPEYEPVAIYRTDKMIPGTEPDTASHCCIERLLLPALIQGKTVSSDRTLVGCGGALNGLGFGGSNDRDMIATVYSEGTPEKEGRHYFDCAERAKRNYIDTVEVTGSGNDAIVVEPVSRAIAKNAPIDVVVFYEAPARLSALMTLVGFARDSPEPPVAMQFAYACEQIYAIPLQEGKKDCPRATLGMSEFYTRAFCENDKFTFAVPYKLYREMDENAERSFLKDERWKVALKNVRPTCCE
ncbi:MAG: DUF169 domain-containing protein [archaeon]|nr:DUF169 domain-containing protein [archaeon]